MLGIRRGGSTLLADMIAAQRGVWFANEPFAVFKDHGEGIKLGGYLPKLKHSQFFDLTDEQSAQVDRYIDLLCHGKVPIGTARRARFPLTADHVCLKVLNAPFLADRFAEQYGMQSVFLTRHPAAQALSVLRQGWGFSAEAYLDKPGFLARYMTDEQIAFCQHTFAEGSDWEKAITNWWLENLYPLRHATTLTHLLTLEELTLKPEQWVDMLCESLRLDDKGSMLAIAGRPSNSSYLSSKEMVAQLAGDDRMKVLTAWQAKLDAQQVTQGQAVLEALGITEYRMDDPLPGTGLLRFG